MLNNKTKIASTQISGDNKSFKIDRNIIFALGYMIWTLKYFLPLLKISQNINNNYANIFRFIGLFLCFTAFVLNVNLQTKIPFKRSLIGIILLAFIVIDNGFLAKFYLFFDTPILIFLAINLNFRKILKFLTIFYALFFFIVITGSIVGFFPSNIYHTAVRTRNSLGFIWSSFPAHGFLYVATAYTILKNKNLNYIAIVILELINVFIFIKTNTKSPFYLLSLYLFCVLLIKWFHIYINKNRIFKIIFLLITPLLSFLIIFLSYNAKTFPSLNNLASNRPLLGLRAINMYGIHPFRPLSDTVSFNINANFKQSTSNLSKYFYVDSSYLQYLILFGYVSLIIFIILIIMLQKRMLKSKNLFLALAFLFAALDGFLDPQFIQTFYNFFILFLATLFSPQNDSLKAFDKNTKFIL